MRSEENTGNGVNGVIQSIWCPGAPESAAELHGSHRRGGVGYLIYLTTIHYTHTAPVCTVTGIINCASVLKSSYSVIPGTSIPITIPGMLWFVVSGALAVVALVSAYRDRPEPERLPLVQLIWAAVGLLFVLYLVFDEIVRLTISASGAPQSCSHVCHFHSGLVSLREPRAQLHEVAGEYRRPVNPERRPRTGGTHGYALPRSARSRAVAGHAPAKARSHRS